MFLPIGDSPNPEKYTPFVTWGLIAVNVAVYLLICLPLSGQPPSSGNPLLADYVKMLLAQGIPTEYVRAILAQTSLNDLLLFQYGYKPSDPGMVSLFTSLFLHSGFMHLAGNMLFLYIYGDNVEHQLGRLKFLLMYLLTGVIATLSFAFFAGNSMTPLVGASGAISGVLGCYFFMFPKNKVKVFLMLLPFYIGAVYIPARIVLGIYVLVDNLLPVLVQSGSNVAYGAHLGGFFGGLLIAAGGEYFGWRLPPGKNRIAPLRHRRGAEKGSATEGAQAIRDAIGSGDIRRLIDCIKNGRAEEFSQLSVDDMITIAKILEKNGFELPASKMLKMTLSTHRQSPSLADVYYELARLRFEQGLSTAAYQYLLAGLDLSPSSETERKIRQLLERIQPG